MDKSTGDVSGGAEDPVRNLLRDAFQAFLHGDTAERDRLCAQAERVIKEQEMAAKAKAINKILTTVGFYVFKDGVAVRTIDAYAASN